MKPAHQAEKRLKGSTMILMAIAMWTAVGGVARHSTEMPISADLQALVLFAVPAILAWGLYFLGFHRVMVEKGYDGEIGLLGLMGPPSLLVLVLLPSRKSGRTGDA